MLQYQDINVETHTHTHTHAGDKITPEPGTVREVKQEPTEKYKLGGEKVLHQTFSETTQPNPTTQH